MPPLFLISKGSTAWCPRLTPAFDAYLGLRHTDVPASVTAQENARNIGHRADWQGKQKPDGRIIPAGGEKGSVMPRVAAFHSVNEKKKPPERRVHHNNGGCPSGSEIPRNERVSGSGGYRLCMHCKNLNK